MSATKRHPDDVTRRIEADGAHTPADIARRMLGDVRATPLLLDVNPDLKPVGVVRAGVLVTLPSKRQLRAFASRHGLTLGFDERAPNGTDARRKWAVLVGDGAKAAPEVPPVQLALSLLARGVSPAETARRVHRQCEGAELSALTNTPDPRLAQVAVFAEGHRLMPLATSRVTTARALLDTTLRGAGFRALLEALARDAEGGAALLGDLLVSAPLATALVRAAPGVVELLRKARDIATEERGARDVSVGKDAVLGALVSACVDGVEPLAAERIALVGLGAEHAAWTAHLEMLRSALKQAADVLPRATLEIVRACAGRTDGARLARPWPVVCRVVRGLLARSASVPVTALDSGLGGLFGAAGRGDSGGAVVPLAVLSARAATCARADDEGEAFARRLAKTVVALFDALRPPPVLDGGTPHARRARRRAAFDAAMSARGAVAPAGVASLFDEVLDAARACGIGRAAGLKPQQVEAARRTAQQLTMSLSVARRPMSELARAIVVVAMAVEPELAQGLLRATGQEAFMQTAAKHAARVLSAAALELG